MWRIEVADALAAQVHHFAIGKLAGQPIAEIIE
jgi:hypothetical protein